MSGLRWQIVFLTLMTVVLKYGQADDDAPGSTKLTDHEIMTAYLRRVTRQAEEIPKSEREICAPPLKQGTPCQPFIGLSVKWKLGVWVKPFTLYTAKLQFAYPIRIPFSVLTTDDPLVKRTGEGEVEENELQELHRRYRREAIQERIDFYQSLEGIMENFGLSPEACILRSICEVAEIPFEESLIGDTLNVLLKASHVGKGESGEDDGKYSKYLEAERIGEVSGNCHKIYANCTTSIFDIVPDFRHEIVTYSM